MSDDVTKKEHMILLGVRNEVLRLSAYRLKSIRESDSTTKSRTT